MQVSWNRSSRFGLKSPIFYSEDFAIDGAAMPKKLCAMQWKASSQRMSRHRTGWGGSLVEDQVRAAGQVSDRRLREGPCWRRGAASRQAREEGLRLMSAKSAPASIENHQWKSARSLMRSCVPNHVWRKRRASRARPGYFARIVESRPDALRSSPRSWRVLRRVRCVAASAAGGLQGRADFRQQFG
jgi:hypothetical protein